MKNNTLVVIGVVVLVALLAYWFRSMRSEPVDTTTDTTDTDMVEESSDDSMPSVPAADDEPVETLSAEVSLSAVSGVSEAQNGFARFTETSQGVEVVVEVTGYQAADPQPMHIHVGECPGVGAVKYPLENLEEGMSTTMLEGATLSQLRSELPLALNVHKSAEEVSVYTACGDLMF